MFVTVLFREAEFGSFVQERFKTWHQYLKETPRSLSISGCRKTWTAPVIVTQVLLAFIVSVSSQLPFHFVPFEAEARASEAYIWCSLGSAVLHLPHWGELRRASP